MFSSSLLLWPSRALPPSSARDEGALLRSIPGTIWFTLLPFCARLRGRRRPVERVGIEESAHLRTRVRVVPGPVTWPWSILPVYETTKFCAHRRAPEGDTQGGAAHSHRRLVRTGVNVRDSRFQRGT